MGYILECESLNGKRKWYGGKLFGYKFVYYSRYDSVDSDSLKYLFDKKYFNVNDYYTFDYCEDNYFIMKVEDFEEWIINYYIPEYLDFWGKEGRLDFSKQEIYSFTKGLKYIKVRWC